jgi:Fic family protein
VTAEGVTPAFYQVDFTKLELIPQTINISRSQIQSVRARFANSGMNRLSSIEMAEVLTALQLKTSTTAATGGEDFRNAILSANRMLCQTLESKEKLTRENLEQINLLANTGQQVTGRINRIIFTGVLRGTNKTVQFQGQEYLIDNSNIQLSQSTVKFNHFLPANEVPSRVDRLLEEVNTVKSETELEAIFGIYNEFIRIHPFIDGNGRTGRMLLNYMLVKAGFLPTPVASESLYFSNLELVYLYLKNVGE